MKKHSTVSVVEYLILEIEYSTTTDLLQRTQGPLARFGTKGTYRKDYVGVIYPRYCRPPIMAQDSWI
jgi:hypothetical protein